MPDKKTKNKKENLPEEDRQFVKKDLIAKDASKKSNKKISFKKIEKSTKEEKVLPKIKKDNAGQDEDSFDEKKIDQQLIEIYENADGTIPDMTHFQKGKRNRFVRAMVVLLFSCLFLAVVAWVGFFILQPKSGFSEKDVILSISGEEEVVVGEELRYRIRYRNDQNVDLTNVLLQVRYPEGFILTDSSLNPTNENKDEWLLGSLDAQESGFIDIFGKMYGNIGEKQSFRVFLDYVAVNFSSEFQKVTNTSIEVTEAPFDLLVEGPKDVVLGSDVEIEVVVDNKENQDLSNLAIEVNGGEIFFVRDSEPAPDQFIDNRWHVNSFGEGNRLLIKGVFDSDILDESGSLEIKLVGWKDADKSVDGYVYSSKIFTANFLQKEISANLVINGTNKNFTVQPGEVLNGTVILKNTGDTPMKGASLRVVLDSPSYQNKSILNWSELENPQDANIVGEQLNPEKRRAYLTWGRGQILDLRQVDPNEEIIADFSLPIKSANIDDLAVYTLSEIEATLEVRYELDGEQEIISTTPILMTLNSDTDLEIRDEVSLEDGKEKYNMTWIVANTFHELKDLRLEADLYGDVIWDEDALNVPAGEVVFDKENQKLVWTIEQMPVSLDVLALQFAFVLNSKNPSQTNLTSKVNFSATDTITGEQILLVGKEMLLNTE